MKPKYITTDLTKSQNPFKGFFPLPISAQFINTTKVEPNPLIKPLKTVSEFDEKGKENIEKWLSFCAIGTTILDTGTKALANLKVLNNRNAIFDLITAFKQLGKHFNGNENFDNKQRETEDFVFTFINLTDEEQKRVVKFQESLINKRK